MSLSLQSIDAMIRTEKADLDATSKVILTSAVNRGLHTSTTIKPPWDAAIVDRASDEMLRSQMKQNMKLRDATPNFSGHRASTTDSHSHSSYALINTKSTYSKSKADSHLQRNIQGFTRNNDSSLTVHQLKVKVDKMRRKMVKERAQANSKIATLRAEKHSAQKKCQATVDKITKTRNQIESGLTTKVAGLEQEIQKSRNKLRTKNKRHKEQEKV